MGDGPTLAELQRWMIDAVRGATVGRPAWETSQLILPSARLGAEERLELYRRSYLLRLLECLREMHPALRHVLGPELFDAFALDYLAARPPNSYTLFDLDEGFADHLAATRPEGDAQPWPHLLIDVVRFERAFHEVYDGPGLEGHVVPSARDVGEAPPGARIQVSPAPCVRLLHSRYPVGDFVLAVRRGKAPGLPSPAPTWLALARRDYAVKLVPLSPCSYAALEALLGGADARRAAEVAGTAHRTVREWIAAWADQGLFAAITVNVPRQQAGHPVETTRKGVRCSERLTSAR
jgi:hypothetical protein